MTIDNPSSACHNEQQGACGLKERRMPRQPKISLMDVHGTVSHLAFAVSKTLEPISAGVSVHWDHLTYLSVEIECYERDKQKVVDRLNHGALVDDYDYRFSVSYPTGGTDPTEWVKVRAYPDMSYDDKKIMENAK